MTEISYQNKLVMPQPIGNKPTILREIWATACSKGKKRHIPDNGFNVLDQYFSDRGVIGVCRSRWLLNSIVHQIWLTSLELDSMCKSPKQS